MICVTNIEDTRYVLFHEICESIEEEDFCLLGIEPRSACSRKFSGISIVTKTTMDFCSNRRVPHDEHHYAPFSILPHCVFERFNFCYKSSWSLDPGMRMHTTV